MLSCFVIQPAHSAPHYEPDNLQSFSPETTAGLKAFFQELNYKWADINNGVPPFILESIPKDIGRTASIKAKKQAFFMALLPMVLLANLEIEHERQMLLVILEKHRKRLLTSEDSNRIKALLKRYGLRGRPFVDHRVRSQLLERVDTIPPALVLAQAANESAWGTSRFAQLGNNLFGQWTYKPGSGIIPDGRPSGEIYEVRKFSSLYASIRSYMNNLNTNGAYRLFREIRSTLRESDKPVTGIALAKGLMQYSERGEEYIREIQAMIQHNKLARTNNTFLRQPETEMLTTLSTDGGGLFSSRNRIIGHRLSAAEPIAD